MEEKSTVDTTPAPAANKYFVEALDRGLKVLDLFGLDAPELRLTDISERAGISKPLAYRITSTLEAGGFLTRDPDTKRYRLGIRVFQLGIVAQHSIDMRRIAHPSLQLLAAETRETVGLIVRDPQGPICVDVIESPQGLRVFAQVGRRMPWHAGSSGKVILAYLPADEQEHILEADHFEKFTPSTITAPNALRETLGQIRRDGYYVGTHDLDEHALGVAAPVFDHEGNVRGAVSVSAPTIRMSEPSEIRWLTEQTLEITRLISRQLGYQPSLAASERVVR
jgi:DNA-binding IclR family transcriptional regulator